jgi:hypothetical protein
VATFKHDGYSAFKEITRDGFAELIIDPADWLDIRQRTEDDISKARRVYDRLTGSAAVLGDIPPAGRVRDAWEAWSTDRRRAAMRAVLHRVNIKPFPVRAACKPASDIKEMMVRRERETAILRQRVEFDWRV